MYGENKVATLKAEMDKYPSLEECSLGICGLICQRGIHAAGLCISNEPYTNFLSAMRAPNGTMCTAFNLWDSEAVSLVKFDLLTVEALQKMHKTMDTMLENGEITWQGSIRETYNKYFHPDVIDYTTAEMWDSITKMYACFQWETPIGVKAITQIKPKNVLDLSAGNSLIRLMPEGRNETPLETYVRYKEHPEQWEQEATEYGLTEEEKQVVREYCEDAHYLADCQEKIMRIAQDKRVSGYTLKESNKLRKSIARKDAKLQAEAKNQFFEWGKKCGTREIFLKYVWEVLFGASFGYSFSSIHSYVYSIIALQELNMYYHYNPIYWNVGCLQSESSADEEGSGSNIDYGKIAKAIQKMQAYGIKVCAPSANVSNLDFTADVKTNRILYGLGGISGINNAIAEQIISNRPYKSFSDFYYKNTFTGSLVTPSKIVSLIKAGCFDEFNSDRIKVMKMFVKLSTQPKQTLTLANIPQAIEIGVAIPKKLLSVYNFRKYCLSKEFFYSAHPNFKSKKLYWLDGRSEKYFKAKFANLLTEGSDWWYDGDTLIVVDKSIDKATKEAMDNLKAFITSQEVVNEFNQKILMCNYKELIKNNEDANHWSFEAVSYYSREHELNNINANKYSITPFESLPEEPRFVLRQARGREWRNYELNQIAGTVIARNDNHHMVTILDYHNNIVNIKLDQGLFAIMKSQISEIDELGNKKVIEPVWLKRGETLIFTGYRNGVDEFRCKSYKNSIYDHKIKRIIKTEANGNMIIQSVRKGIEE